MPGSSATTVFTASRAQAASRTSLTKATSLTAEHLGSPRTTRPARSCDTGRSTPSPRGGRLWWPVDMSARASLWRRTPAAGRLVLPRAEVPTRCFAARIRLSWHGLRAAAVGGVDTVRINGTSVAAPALTRMVAAWMHAFGALGLEELRDGIAVRAAAGPEAPPSSRPDAPPVPTGRFDEREGSGRV